MAVMHAATVEDTRIAGLHQGTGTGTGSSWASYKEAVVPYISAGFKAIAERTAPSP